MNKKEEKLERLLKMQASGELHRGRNTAVDG